MLAELLAAAVLSGASAPGVPCGSSLPSGPAVPAPIVFKTGCGGFLLSPSGQVTRLSRAWFANHGGGTGRAYGADLEIRRNRAGRISLFRRGRLVWRSHGLYPNTGGDIAFGPGVFAFSSYYQGVFLTDLRGPERLVVAGRGRYPYGFFASGRLIVTGGRAITVLAADGLLERRYPYRPGRGFALHAATNTLYFVTVHDRLATLRESRLRVGRRLHFAGLLSLSKPQRLLFYGTRSLTLTSLDGRPLARAAWRRGRLDFLDSGAVVSRDGRFVAYRLSDARAGARKGSAVLYLLRAGARAQPIYRHRLGPIGCRLGASMYWHQGHLLYGSADGALAVIDARSGQRLDLTAFAKQLPRRGGEQLFAHWRSGYPG